MQKELYLLLPPLETAGIQVKRKGVRRKQCVAWKRI